METTERNYTKAPERIPEVLLPHNGRNDSAFARDIAREPPDNKLFRKGNFTVEIIGDEALGTESETIDPFGITTSKFNVMTPMRFPTWVERIRLTNPIWSAASDFGQLDG